MYSLGAHLLHGLRLQRRQQVVLYRRLQHPVPQLRPLAAHNVGCTGSYTSGYIVEVGQLKFTYYN
jgi:hypothetical protein